MLNIVFGDIENSIYHPPTYFDNQYEDEWITDPLSIKMIKDIDKSEVISPHLIESPVLGPITPKQISGGVKTMMLMAFDQSGKIFHASLCGDNCAKWIVHISTRKDLTINLHHVLDFSSADRFDAFMINIAKTIHCYKEYPEDAIRIKER